jgi:hypothetical protein
MQTDEGEHTTQKERLYDAPFLMTSNDMKIQQQHINVLSEAIAEIHSYWNHDEHLLEELKELRNLMKNEYLHTRGYI